MNPCLFQRLPGLRGCRVFCPAPTAPVQRRSPKAQMKKAAIETFIYIARFVPQHGRPSSMSKCCANGSMSASGKLRCCANCYGQGRLWAAWRRPFDVRFRLLLRWPMRLHALHRDTIPCCPSLCAQAKDARRAGFPFSCRSGEPSSAAWNVCHRRWPCFRLA